LRLTGTYTVLASKGEFEILIDGRGDYYRRTWDGAAGDRRFSWDVQIMTPYWSGAEDESWSEDRGGRGGGGGGYTDTSGTPAVARRLAHDGQFGATKDNLEAHGASFEEKFDKLTDFRGMTIPASIAYTDKARDTPLTTNYVVLDAELVADPDHRMIADLKTKYPMLAELQHKDSFYPNGKKQNEYVFDGDIPVRFTMFYDNGNRERDELFMNGIECSQTQWYADGHCRSVEIHRGNSYIWIGYDEDGHNTSQGQWTYAHTDTPLYDLQTGWEITYYPDGRKKSLYNLKDNMMDGLCQSWDSNGALVDDGVYRDDKPWQGTFVHIKPAGTGLFWGEMLTSMAGSEIFHYKDGKLVSTESSTTKP
jgi:antitoxin component YwqK of YwqJK toxin-antitoxin module